MFFFDNYSFKNFYTPKQKKNIKIFFVLSLIGMALEMLGIGLMMPFLSILIEPIYSEKLMNYINNFGFNLITQKDLIIFSIGLLCYIIIFSYCLRDFHIFHMIH